MSTTDTSKGMDRRRFIATSGCAAMGLTTFFSSLINLKAMAAAALDKRAEEEAPYKAMVCLLLTGGADSHNMLIPRSAVGYNHYLTTRSNLAVPATAMHPLNYSDAHGEVFGVHPGMAEVASMFNAGKMSFVANVGTLVEPLTKQQYLSGNKKLPMGLFSHSDQIKHWQTGRPGERHRYGWGGRIADLLAEQNTNPAMSMNISLSGTNQFQQGMFNTEFAVSASERFGIVGYDRSNHYHPHRNEAINGMLDKSYADVFEQTYINTLKHSVTNGESLRQALTTAPEFNDLFSNTPLSQRFRTVARIIAGRDRLGAQRQTFFINFGGWDHHEEVIEATASKLPELSRALSEFNQAMELLEQHNNVTTFTISDFGRTLTSNGNGSDHGWGGNALVMGGSVNGGQVFGKYPSLEEGSEYYLDRGVMLPTTSATEYMAELALWFGVSPSDLVDIFPDLPNFVASQQGTPPLGFMNFNNP